MKPLCLPVLAGSLLFLLPVAFSQQPSAAATEGNAAAKAASASELEAWRSATTAAPPSDAGCYKVEYPAKRWEKIDCGPPPADPSRTIGPEPPAGKGVQPNAATPLSGDYVMNPTNKITSATGRVIALNQVTSVGSVNASNNAYSANLFSIQVNTNNNLAANSGSITCKGSFNPGNCKGWTQFVYNDARQFFIQYWFLNYLAKPTQSCPSSLPFSGKGNPRSSSLHCGANAVITTLPSSAVADFTKMQGATLTGQVLSNGNVSATLNAGGTSYNITGTDQVGLGGNWSSAEFNVFGRGGISSGNYNQVQLNTAAQVTIGLTSDNDLSLQKPGCPGGPTVSTTAEFSNMFLGPCSTTTTPGIYFHESPTTPQLTGLNPSQGPATGGTAVQVLGGPFNLPFQLDWNMQPVTSINTLPNDVTVNSLPGVATNSVPVTAAYIFPDGGLGPFSAPQQFTYYGTPGCKFSESCPFYENQPPTYTASCGTPTDFYTTSDIHTPADFNLVAANALTNTGSTTGEAVTLAACQPQSKTACDFYSIDVPSSQWCHGNPPHPPQPPPSCSKCGGEKCCPSPDGSGGTVCVAKTATCPVIH